jgi:RHH-type proline utilization regulon transcriptional repressor/proline dehydrogenase/delta 1-pyrroline-5-carboxylate dehydrogenase
MAVVRSRPDPLDLDALEARTQAIGRELFEAATRHHAHLSALNRWTAQVLSWCLSDPALKAALLRFIDVLPSLGTPREIARHLRETLPSDVRLPAALRLGTEMARRGLVTQGALAAVVHQLVERLARQFIAEHEPEAVVRVVQDLAARGATCSLDILGEQVLTEAEADRYVEQCGRLLRRCAEAVAVLPDSARPRAGPPPVNLSVKPSALTPRFDTLSPGDSVERASRRLLPLLREAAERSAVVNLDMEQSELRDLTVALAQRLLTHPDAAHAVPLGVVVQAYLRDAEESVEALLAWLAAHQRTLIIRLVKGAYWDSEVAWAAQRHWPPPVYRHKAETDRAFERLTRRLLGAAPLVTTAIASHNVRSIAHAMAAAEALGLSKHQLEFQFLYGMGEALQAAVVSMGYPVRVYTPVGELIPGMAYLVRRILENTANESFLRQDFFEGRTPEALLAPPDVHPGSATAPVAAEPPVPGLAGFRGEPLRDFSAAAARDRMAAALASVRTMLGRDYPLLIGADAVRTRATLTVRNPADPEQVVGRVASAGREEVDRAVRAAEAAQPAWGARPVRARVACLERAAHLLRERYHELAAWTVFEAGKTWREADVEIVEAVEYLDYYGRCMLELEAGRPLLQLPGERNAYRYLPRGVAAVIAPWNFPAAILMGMASAALAAGNAVILKPAEQSPVIAAHLAAILRAAGVPPGVLQYLPGTGEEAGAALARHPGVHTILFTGSKAVGLSLARVCAEVQPGQRFVKHLIAEMGGKNAVIVDADADLDAAVAGILRSAFSYAGQKCSAASRLVVHAAVHDRLLERLSAAVDRLVLGSPADPAVDVGPLIEEAAQRRLLEAAARARQVATVAYRYPDARVPQRGWFFGPTLVTDVPLRDPLATEELFGPLVCVFRAESFALALELANDSDTALTGGVYSRSPSHLEQAVRAFDVGNLYLNRPITGAMVGRQPFGGHRLSGLGTKAGGPDYLLQLLLPKTICADTTRHGIPLD